MNSNELYDMLATLVKDTVATGIPDDFFKNASEGASAVLLDAMVDLFPAAHPNIAERIKDFALLDPIELFGTGEELNNAREEGTLHLFDLDPLGFMFVMILARKSERGYFTCKEAHGVLLNRLWENDLYPLAYHLNDGNLDFKNIGECLEGIF